MWHDLDPVISGEGDLEEAGDDDDPTMTKCPPCLVPSAVIVSPLSSFSLRNLSAFLHFALRF